MLLSLSTICHLQTIAAAPVSQLLFQTDSPTTQLFGSPIGNDMESNTIKSCKLVDPKEEFLIDLDASIQENKLTLGSVD